MPRHVYNIPSITIGSGNNNSDAVNADPHYQKARGLVIEAPDALTGTVTVAVSFDGGSSFSKLQSSGSDVAVGAGDAVVIDFQGWDALRVESTSAEGADRTFVLRGVEELY